MKTFLIPFCLLALALGPAPSAFGQGTAFTYQGLLTRGNSNTSGSYDMTFALFNASSGGAQAGATITNTAISASNGLFLVALDFGSVFTGAAYWLEIGVRSNGVGSFATLAPRQQLTPTPYAITAENLGGSLPASQLTGTLAPGLLPIPLDLSGSTAAPLLEADQAGNGPAILGSRTATTGTSAGVKGTTASTTAGANAVYGLVTSSSPGLSSAGVRGENLGTNGNGIGVWGSQAGSGWGVYGSAPAGIGVYGESPSGTGVQGASSSAVGVFGTHAGATGTAAGVQGTTASTTAGANAVYGLVTSSLPGLDSAGVRGENFGTNGNGIGVWGSQAGSGLGVYGYAPAGIGVGGESPNGIGVYGTSASGTGVLGTHASSIGTNAAIQGTTASTDPFANGVYGVVSATAPGQWAAGVRGQNYGTGFTGIGVYGSQAGSGYGVYGYAPSGYGVVGESSTSTGVYASSTSGPALTIGNGAIQVSGAGLGTGTAAFIQLATIYNSYGVNTSATRITNPLCDGDPNAILIVTHNQSVTGSSADLHAHSVQYDAAQGHWAILHDDSTSIESQAFNVLIIKP
jgi:hypothetical protein